MPFYEFQLERDRLKSAPRRYLRLIRATDYSRHSNLGGITSKLTEGPLEDLVVHDGAGLPVHHPVRDGLVAPPELPLALRGLDGGRPPERKRQRAPERYSKINKERR